MYLVLYRSRPHGNQRCQGEAVKQENFEIDHDSGSISLELFETNFNPIWGALL
jgi:hypothetical protein